MFLFERNLIVAHRINEYCSAGLESDDTGKSVKRERARRISPIVPVRQWT